ncbi:putative endoglucanase-like [Sesbania bispinosa]|nr:putative endoglucanase-like [Sesbania bispinosa]
MWVWRNDSNVNIEEYEKSGRKKTQNHFSFSPHPRNLLRDDEEDAENTLASGH